MRRRSPHATATLFCFALDPHADAPVPRLASERAVSALKSTPMLWRHAIRSAESASRLHPSPSILRRRIAAPRGIGFPAPAFLFHAIGVPQQAHPLRSAAVLAHGYQLPDALAGRAS